MTYRNSSPAWTRADPSVDFLTSKLHIRTGPGTTHLRPGVSTTAAIAADVCADIPDAQLRLCCLSKPPGLYWQPLALPVLTALCLELCGGKSSCQLCVCRICGKPAQQQRMGQAFEANLIHAKMPGRYTKPLASHPGIMAVIVLKYNLQRYLRILLATCEQDGLGSDKKGRRHTHLFVYAWPLRVTRTVW